MGDLEKKYIDMTPEEIASLKDYENKGMPGLHKISDTDVFQAFSLYMSGKSYREIADLCHMKRDLVLWLSQKNNWHQHKVEYYTELTGNMIAKTQQVKLEGAHTIAAMIAALNKYYADKFNLFLKTGDTNIIDNLDSKWLNHYYRALGAVDELIGLKPKDKDQSPLINIHVTDTTQVKDISEDEELSEVDPKKLLLLLSNAKRANKKE